MTQEMKSNLKRHAISAGVSFATGFVLYMSSQLDMITVESVENGAVVGLVIAAVRAGIKVLLESVVASSKTLLLDTKFTDQDEKDVLDELIWKK